MTTTPAPGRARQTRASIAAKEVIDRNTGALTAAVENSNAHLDGLMIAASDALTRMRTLQPQLLRAMSVEDYQSSAKLAMQMASLARIIEVRLLCANERRYAVLEAADIMIQAGGAQPMAPREKTRMQARRRKRDEALAKRASGNPHIL